MERSNNTNVRRLGSGSKLKDYPFVRRLRNRRLLAYLRTQGFEPAYDWITLGTDVHMSAAHLRQLVARFQFGEAISYIRRFLPPSGGRDEPRSLVFFIQSLWTLANVAAMATGIDAVPPAVYYRDVTTLITLCSCDSKIPSILQWLTRSPKFRASLDWGLVTEKASSIAVDLALEAPELRRKLLLPAGDGPQDLLPIGPRLSPRRHSRERAPQLTPSAIAKCYLNRKRRLPSLSPFHGVNKEALNRVLHLLEVCLKAGKRPELHQGQPLHSSAKDAWLPAATSNYRTVAGPCNTPFLQTRFGTPTCPVENIGTSSVTNAGAPASSQPSYHWAPSLVNSGVCSPFFQTMSGTLTDPAKNIGTSSVRNAGDPTFTGQPNYLWPSVANSGAPTFTGQPRIPSVAISGAPVSQPAKKNGIMSTTNAATIKQLSEDGSVLRKNPRAELATLEEDDPDKKRQRTKLIRVGDRNCSWILQRELEGLTE